MNLQQLRYLCAVVDKGLNLSKAAEALFTSQPGISKQIRLLEEEVDAVLLARHGNRVTGLTEPGRRIVDLARRVLRDIDNMRRVGSDYKKDETGSLLVATTHVHARYLLLPVVKEFQKRFPGVQLMLRQGNPEQILDLVNTGAVDLGLCSAPMRLVPDLVALPCYRVPRCVVVPARHALLRKNTVSLPDLAAYPMIMLDPAFSGGVSVWDAFKAGGIEPRVVMTATDADVVKAYVEAGCGIATLPEVAFDAKRDRTLRAINARHLFAPSISNIWVQRGRYLRRFALDFMEMLSPVWTATEVDRSLAANARPADPTLAIEPPR